MSEIKVDTLTGMTTANDITVTVGASATMSLEQGLAKSFVRYDASSGAAIADSSLNLSSISDNGTGNYTMVFSSSFSDGEFAFTTGSSAQGTDGRIMFNSNADPAAGSFRVVTQNSSFSNVDVTHAACTFHGDLA